MGKDDDEFDLEGWISSARLPERSVTLYARGDLYAAHQAAEAELRAYKVVDDRIGQDPTGELAQRVRDLETQMRGSAKVFRVRALTAAEQDRVRKDAGEDAEDVSAQWLALSTIEPVVTVDQVRRLRERLGEGQYLAWFTASTSATNEKVTVPFSLAASGSLSPARS